jgi:hypothetical protein
MSVVDGSGGCGGGAGGGDINEKSKSYSQVGRSRSASSLKFLPFGKRCANKVFYFVCFIVRVFGNTFFLD